VAEAAGGADEDEFDVNMPPYPPITHKLAMESLEDIEVFFENYDHLESW